jgi:hypothetical protein
VEERVTPFEELVLRALWLIMRWQMGFHVLEAVEAWRRAAAAEIGEEDLPR